MANSSLEHLRHSLAHLLGAAVLELYPGSKLAIGPSIDDGFYYDIDVAGVISDNDLPEIEKKMHEILKTWKTFEGREVTAGEAKELFQDNQYKKEIIDELTEKKEKITLYTSGNFTDLCRGGHIENAKDINPKTFKLSRVAGAYWRGDEKNPQLTRIYGYAFATKDELQKHLIMLEEAKKRDHKKLGLELDLFLIDEVVGKGLPMWTPKGTAIKFELENFTRELERKYDYEHISTPYLGGEKLYQMSGHLDHYSQSMYAPIDMDGDRFYLRPMACPHHIRMYQRRQWSYRELPVRYAEISDYNRYEKSGELMGMIRVRKFQLTDAHLFVTPEGLKYEFKRVAQMIMEGMGALGLLDIVSYRFSKRNPENKEKYYPDDSLWNRAESTMKEALDELGISYTEAPDEAAFYGPKLDIQAKNANGKEDTLFTAQIDFLLPEKFNMEYIAADGSKKRPVMIHRSTIGSLERTFAFLIEHYAGSFPVWLSPVQASILPISDKQNRWAEKVYRELKAKGIRVEINANNETLGKKIREAEIQKIPYLLVIGDKEIEAESVAVRKRGKGDLGQMKIKKFIKKIKEEVATKKP